MDAFAWSIQPGDWHFFAYLPLFITHSHTHGDGILIDFDVRGCSLSWPFLRQTDDLHATTSTGMEQKHKSTHHLHRASTEHGCLEYDDERPNEQKTLWTRLVACTSFLFEYRAWCVCFTHANNPQQHIHMHRFQPHCLVCSGPCRQL